MSDSTKPTFWQQAWPSTAAGIIILLLTWVGSTYASMANRLQDLSHDVAILKVEVQHLNRQMDAMEERQRLTAYSPHETDIATALER